jgi:hypothetical protein
MAGYSVDYDGNLDTTDDRVSYGSFDAAVGGIGDRGFESYGVQDNRRGGGGNLGSFGIGSQDDPGGRAGAGWSALNDARQVGGMGGLLGGFFNPGRMFGAGIGSLVAGPIGGLLGGLIGGGIGSGSQRGSWGYTDAQGNRVSAGRDMIDGGGRGRAGDRFEGGLLSGIGNSLGIRPAGYRDRQNAMQAQMTPDQIRAEMAGQAPRSFVPQPASPASPSITPAPPAPQAPMMPQAMGQTMPRALTAEDLARLGAVGMGQGAMVGEPATPQEMAFLVRGPGMVMGMGGPNAYAPFAPENPAMDAVFQGTPGVNVGQSDLGTLRPGISARNRTMFNTGLLGR